MCALDTDPIHQSTCQHNASLHRHWLDNQLVHLVTCRYEKRHSNLAVHVSPCFRVSEGDIVTCGQCRWASLRTLAPCFADTCSLRSWLHALTAFWFGAHALYELFVISSEQVVQ